MVPPASDGEEQGVVLCCGPCICTHTHTNTKAQTHTRMCAQGIREAPSKAIMNELARDSGDAPDAAYGLRQSLGTAGMLGWVGRGAPHWGYLG